MLPRHLRNFTAFVDGVGQAGQVDELTLPTLNLATEEHRAGGMDAPVEIDMGMEMLELSMVLSSYEATMFTSYGALESGVPLTVRGAIQRQGEAAQAVVIRMVGSVKSIDRGSWTAGQKATTTVTYTLTKYSETVGGVQLVNIDIENMIRAFNGVDQLASQRAALGL
jgi:uncharacterized protein